MRADSLCVAEVRIRDESCLVERSSRVGQR